MLDVLTNLLNLVSPYVKPVFEVGILTALIYSVLFYLRGTRGAPVLSGILIVLLALTLAADYFNFEVISRLLNGLWAVMGVALVVIFQPEFRRAFAQIGSRSFMRGIRRQETINELAQAVVNMAARRNGALIVIEQEIGMRALVNDAVTVDAKLTNEMLESIFYPNSPLHDGGVIIKNDRILAAHCILPLSSNQELVKYLGTRHRAALGVTEETDALVIVVSEETGSIALAHKGNLKRNIRPDRLRRFLTMLLNEEHGKSIQDLMDEMSESDNTEGFTA